MNDQLCLTEQQINIIYKIPLFRGISDDFKKELFEKLDYTVFLIKKGDIVIEQGTQCNHLHILLAAENLVL